jgi:hypothetical protein
MTVPESDERLFDDPAGWGARYKDDRFDQRLRIVGDTFFAETLVRIRSSPAAVLALLQQPWDWWAHARIISSTRHSDGSLEMDMKPIWWYVARLSMRILPPEPLPDVRATRLPVIYTGGFDGRGTIDVYADPSDAARSILRGRCTRIRPHVRMLFANATTVGLGHLRTESGRMMLPFARGTGYVGLIRRAEEQAVGQK